MTFLHRLTAAGLRLIGYGSSPLRPDRRCPKSINSGSVEITCIVWCVIDVVEWYIPHFDGCTTLFLNATFGFLSPYQTYFSTYVAAKLCVSICFYDSGFAPRCMANGCLGAAVAAESLRLSNYYCIIICIMAISWHEHWVVVRFQTKENFAALKHLPLIHSTQPKSEWVSGRCL